MWCSLRDAIYVVQSMWCNLRGAIYAVQPMWCNLCGAIYVCLLVHVGRPKDPTTTAFRPSPPERGVARQHGVSQSSVLRAQKGPSGWVSQKTGTGKRTPGSQETGTRPSRTAGWPENGPQGAGKREPAIPDGRVSRKTGSRLKGTVVYRFCLVC